MSSRKHDSGEARYAGAVEVVVEGRLPAQDVAVRVIAPVTVPPATSTVHVLEGLLRGWSRAPGSSAERLAHDMIGTRRVVDPGWGIFQIYPFWRDISGKCRFVPSISLYQKNNWHTAFAQISREQHYASMLNDPRTNYN